ncbi:MAG: xanthine dehydrogenase family protein molybdopterin-binding subunit [Chloroflexota bacterium]|nr:xanthine dehydrogenase family protein molybdopterin-binding subunit [Chloroflexota bacterium]
MVVQDKAVREKRTWVGTSVKRREDPKILAGRGTYIDDVKLPGMLHAAVLRSPHAHARIVRIDTSEALKVPGVVAVLTGQDATKYVDPMPAFCAEPVKQHAIAIDTVRFGGEAVAAVAATSRYAAEDACARIDVEYEVLPPLNDPFEAMKPEAPRLHDTLESNVVFERTLSFGDVAGDFARADRVIKRRLRWHRMGAQPIETAGAVASFDPFSGMMTVWSNTNMYSYIPWVFAQMLRVPNNRLKIIPCLVGGSFGSKHLLSKCFLVAGALAKATGRPVKFMEDRIDNLAANDNVGPDRFYEAELAVANDGEFLGLRLDIVDDYGAYFQQFATGQHGNALSQPTGPYRIKSLEYGVKAVLTNKVQQGFFRGAGADPGNFAIERLVDAAAEELGIDRAEIRRKNFIRPDEFPYKIPTGNIYDSGNYAGVLDKALAAVNMDEWRREQARLRDQGRYIGIGLASCQERSAYSATEWWFWYDKPPFPLTTTPESVKVSFDAFGNVVATLGCPFWGNSPGTVVAQVLAEEFGIDPDQVVIDYADSQGGALSAGPGGSRLTVMLSGATRGASGRLKEKMARIAAHLLETDAADIEFADGKVGVRGAPDKSLSIGDLALKAHMFKLDLPEDVESGLSATYTYDHPYTTKPSDDRKDLGAFYPIVSHACHVPIVEVDAETGQVAILKYVAVSDCGTVMNPQLLEGQIVGGIAQGIGAAFLEEYVYDENGQLATSTFADYLLPTAHDVPATFEVSHQETPSPFTEFGVKGGGEGGRMVAPIALASAVEDALRPLGVRVNELPMTPERIVDWIEQAGVRR